MRESEDHLRQLREEEARFDEDAIDTPMDETVRRPAANEEERFYEDIPDFDAEESYAANLPAAGENRR